MKTIMKKIVTLMVTIAIVTSQIGCAGKVTKISVPLDQVKFEKNYKYKVVLKSGEQTKIVNNEQVQISQNQLKLGKNPNMQLVPSEKINRIVGQSTVKNGSNALLGMTVGAAILGVGTFGLAQEGKCKNDNHSSDACLDEVGMIGVTAVGAGLGALFGLGIGALIPKYDKVQITPIVSPSTSGVDAGVNVGVKF